MQRCESFKSILYNHIVAMSPPPLTQTNIVAVLSLSFHLPLTCHHLLNINSLHVSSDCMRHYRSHVQRWSQSRKCKKTEHRDRYCTVCAPLFCFCHSWNWIVFFLRSRHLSNNSIHLCRLSFTMKSNWAKSC